LGEQRIGLRLGDLRVTVEAAKGRRRAAAAPAAAASAGELGP